MHESDAMEFINPVLRGFLSRVFNSQEGEEPDRYEPHLEKIRAFIKDKTPYWVREKSLHLICEIEAVENSFKIDRYTPTSPKDCIEFILLTVQKRIMEIAEHYRLKSPSNRMHTVHDLPTFPKI
jgi:hypothetical protein